VVENKHENIDERYDFEMRLFDACSKLSHRIENREKSE